MRSDHLKKFRIFAASPSDVASERARLETVVALLRPMADYLGLTLEVVDWRAVVPDAGRPQQIIFDQLKPTSWDIFVGILWHRFGTPPGAKDKTGKDYLSGTEEEFKTAYELWKQYGKPRIIIYRCTRALPYDVDPNQLKRVREFFKLIEDVKGNYPTLYQAFDTPESFEKLVLDNLQKLLIEYGEQSKTPITPEVAEILVPKIPNNLPRRAAFFGRAKEMGVVMRALSPSDRTWGVLVDGIGGIGKSAIAVEAAYRAQEAGLFDAFAFITAKQNILEPSGIRELTQPVRTLDEFLNETARVLGQVGIAKLVSDEKRRALLDVLRATRALLIYDNLETLSKEEQEEMADFLRELPQGCKAIITSRRRGGEGAVWLRVEKLDWDAACGIIENEMERDAGLANKLRRFESLWQELYDETNGSPLALVHTLGLMRVRATLTFDGALEMLRGNRDEDLQKFIFQEAHKELTTNDKTALGTLSFFVPSATFEAWGEVANLSRNALETTIDRLSALSLVDVLTGEERYALHPLTRDFVRDELLADANVTRETGMRFARFWVEYAKQNGRYSLETYTKLEMEWTNLAMVANWLLAEYRLPENVVKNSEVAFMLVDLADALTRFLFYSGRWDERVRWSGEAYYAAQIIEKPSKAGWQAFLVAYIHYARGLIADSTQWVNLGTEVWHHSKLAAQRASWMRGLIAWHQKEFDKARILLSEALALSEELERNDEVVGNLNNLAELSRECRDYGGAYEYYRKGLEFAQKVQDKSGQTLCVNGLGNLSVDREQLVDAHQWFEQGFTLAKKVGRVELIAQAQYGLARVHEAEGSTDLALPLAQEALKIYKRLQHKDFASAQELVERLTIALNKKEN